MELRSEQIVKVYKDRMVVKGVDIHVKSGEIVGLLGPNGAGKTTSFYMMVGFISPTKGRVFIDGDDVTKLPMYERARHGLGKLACRIGANFRRQTRAKTPRGSPVKRIWPYQISQAKSVDPLRRRETPYGNCALYD